MGPTETTATTMPDKDYRALLTDREREILTGDADVSEGYYYRVVTRVRRKIERLDDDVAIIIANHDGLAEELRAAVCDHYDDPDRESESETGDADEHDDEGES